MEFSEGIDRLKDVFGDRAYSPERVKLIWKLVGREDRIFWHQCLDQLIGSSRQPPLLQEISQILYESRAKRSSETKKIAKEESWEFRYSCDFCYDNGVYLANKKGHTGEWAFRCHCEKGDFDPRKNIPQFKKAHYDQGYFWSDVTKSRNEVVSA